jgi:hypothetical protein
MGSQIKDFTPIIQHINTDTFRPGRIENFVNGAAKHLIKIQVAADDFGDGI